MKTIYLLMVVIFLSSCQKELLELKPRKSLLVPKTLKEFRALLDNTYIMNKVMSLSWIACDDIVTTDAGLLEYNSASERNSYIWAEDIYEGSPSSDWNGPFEQIFYANIILDGLSGLGTAETQEKEFKSVKGAALFHRGLALFNLSQQFAEPYNPTTAKNTKGIPVRLKSDINDNPGRGILLDTYHQIIDDFKQSAELLPANSTVKTRPSRHAALAYLARVYLTMQDYDVALQYAEEALALGKQLLDYNISPPFLFPTGNSEVIFNAGTPISYSFFSAELTGVNPAFYATYNDSDLRKLYYVLQRSNGVYWYRGNYAQNTEIFQGMATDELYLTKAECQARKGLKEQAMTTLNLLMINRWKKDEFKPFEAFDAEQALSVVLSERRKELLGRGTRWTDLRRLNQDDRFKVTITRVLQGQTYTLLPQDKRYTYPIPDNEINGSGIEQNLRK